MTLANVALTNTFDDWRTRTNQLVVLANQMTENVYTTSGNVVITNSNWNQSGGSNVSLNVANGYIRGNGFGITAIQNSNISGTLTNSQIQNNIITLASSYDGLKISNLSSDIVALGNTVYMNIVSSSSAANQRHDVLATSNAVNTVLNRVEAANSDVVSRITTVNSTVYTIGTSGNAYATAVGTSGNAYAASVGVGANAYTAIVAGAAFNKANAALANASGTVFSGSLLVAGNVTAQGNVYVRSASLVGTAQAGAIEYDGTTFYATPNTATVGMGRSAIPTTVYGSGANPAVATAGATGNTQYALFPTTNDTITLPVGTYHVTVRANLTITGSTTSSNVALNVSSGGTAVGTMSWMGGSGIIVGGATSQYAYPATSITLPLFITTASATNPRNYLVLGEGLLKITTAGTIIPSYQFPVTLVGATSNVLSSDNYMLIRSLDTQSATTFGPAGSGWT